MPQLVGKEVGPIGFGLMGFTWRADPPPQSQAFDAMKTALALGANSWNGGELYGTPERNSLHLLNEYFTKYPEDADKIVLSIKGGLKPGQMAPDGSPENVARSINECLKVLDGKKFLDLFECARVDPNTPIETTIKAIDKFVQEGKIGGISLSEVSADSIRRAAKVAKISAVEVEFSLWATDILENGIAQACAELDIPIIAYSPLGRGFLTGQIKSPADIPDNDFRKTQPRFQPDVFDENLKLVKDLQEIAQKKGCAPASLAISWITQMSGKNGMPVMIPIPGATTSERVKENMTHVELTNQEIKDINDILSKATIIGDRYGGHAAALMNG